MQNPPELEPPSDTSLYVRWGADRSRYALEIKLELIGKLRRVLSETDNKSTEIGGVLLGSLPTPNAATLRIEDVELIARDPADGATFMLDPRQGDRFAEVRRRARERGKAAVGLFRSHIRAGALRPSIADRTLLHDKFEQGTYSLLLVQGSLPFQAAVFIADNGQLPAEPSVREFNLDEQDFRNLPEIEPERPAKPVPDKPVPEQPVPGQKNYRTLGLVFLALLVCGIVIWALTGREGFGSRLGATNEIQLAVAPEGSGIRISWDHTAREFKRASGARLLVNTSGQEREVRLGLDELRLGAVQFETNAPGIEATLILDKPGSSSAQWSAQWSR